MAVWTGALVLEAVSESSSPQIDGYWKWFEISISTSVQTPTGTTFERIFVSHGTSEHLPESVFNNCHTLLTGVYSFVVGENEI